MFRYLLLAYEREKLELFLKRFDLRCDEDIEYALVYEENEEIKASACISGNIVKCIAIYKSLQGNNFSATLLTQIADKLRELNINEYFIFTKPCNVKVFESLGLYLLCLTKDVALFENTKLNYENYKFELAKHYKRAKKIGSIVMNLNPMSKGHLYLIQKALKHCEILHIFILSEDLSMFNTKARLEIVRNELKDYKNIIIHESKNYIISKATFPTYFLKDNANVNEIYSRLDITLFATKIAPILGINMRFFGTEPKDKITKDYNQKAKEILKEFKIKFYEISRARINKKVISASRIRKIILNDKDYLNNKELKSLCANSTYEYLKNNLITKN
ncbi:[citrate (pro-3S)-lyase] ligase [Campylobacter sp. RM12637]|uniref:[citrate (pro-3S)-lyase] ligase n=1 Tax=Campylobacter sp. RM12637 TaxID=2735734 RepID=UPI0030151DA1|nr:[citrate (pro-3S)-lyase] ligase [Campylobacter sp. RM12637]